jgi:hypothetical protein
MRVSDTQLVQRLDNDRVVIVDEQTGAEVVLDSRRLLVAINTLFRDPSQRPLVVRLAEQVNTARLLIAAGEFQRESEQLPIEVDDVAELLLLVHPEADLR